MSERIVSCESCGVRAGIGSDFRRGVCSQCRAEEIKRRGTRTAIWHVSLMIGAVYFYVRSDGLSEPLDPVAFIVLAIAFFDLLLIGVTVIHEMAHAVTALLLGFGVREVSIGMGPKIASTRAGHTRLVFNLYPVGGHTLTLPRGDSLRLKMVAVSAAGPVSHIPLAAWLATLSTGRELWDILLGPAPELVMFYFLVNVIPIVDNDGRNLVRLLRMPEDQLMAVGSAVSSLTELVPTIDDPVANPANTQQRRMILDHLSSPGLTPSDRALALNNLAVVDILLGDPDLLDEADGASREALEMMPERPELQNTRGSVLILRGEYAKGIALMKPTMSRIPADAVGDSHLELAHAYVQLGHAFEGRDHLYAANGRNSRPGLFNDTLVALGGLEASVIRGFAEPGEDAGSIAARFRAAAGPQAMITGAALRTHIEVSGEDRDLEQVARSLCPD